MDVTTTLSLDERSRIANAFMDEHDELDELVAVSCRYSDDGILVIRAQVLGAEAASTLPSSFEDDERGEIVVEHLVVGDVQVAV